MTVNTLNFIPMLIVLQQNLSNLVETCMKNAAHHFRGISLTKVNVINGTTQNLIVSEISLEQVLV